jgi:hypothetical protein
MPTALLIALDKDPSNGCPAVVTIDTDKSDDKVCNDSGALKNTDDKIADKTISGAAHLIGLANVVFLDGSTNTVLLPNGYRSGRDGARPSERRRRTAVASAALRAGAGDACRTRLIEPWLQPAAAAPLQQKRTRWSPDLGVGVNVAPGRDCNSLLRWRGGRRLEFHLRLC